MGEIDKKKIAIDTMILVYLLEDAKDLGNTAEKILSSAETVYASILCHLEVAVGYCKKNDAKNLHELSILSQLFPDFQYIPVNMDISLQAAHLRAKYPSLKTPDSIHIATGIIKKADYFITDDKRLKNIKEIPILTIDEIKAKTNFDI